MGQNDTYVLRQRAVINLNLKKTRKEKSILCHIRERSAVNCSLKHCGTLRMENVTRFITTNHYGNQGSNAQQINTLECQELFFAISTSAYRHELVSNIFNVLLYLLI